MKVKETKGITLIASVITKEENSNIWILYFVYIILLENYRKRFKKYLHLRKNVVS